MKERGIMFSSAMVRALLDGRKTQTRRLVTPQPSDYVEGPLHWPRKHAAPYLDQYNKGPFWCWWSSDDRQGPDWIKCPYGVAGDRLWVRETWAALVDEDTLRQGPAVPANARNGCAGDLISYRATDMDDNEWPGFRWRPSIHMPRWASRITLEIADVRVERLQDISEQDALAEGCEPRPPRAFATERALTNDGLSACEVYERLWDSLNAKRAPWSSNPWVWVLSFLRVESADFREAGQ
jgi:hypothetical protein